MNKNDLIESYPGFFVSEIREDALWLKFSGNFFHNVVSFDHRDFIIDYFERVGRASDIKTVIFYSSYPESISDEYLRFFLFESPERKNNHNSFWDTVDRNELHRFCNIIDQLILKIVSFDKIIIHVCKGNVLSLFMNFSLACDYRIASSNTVFYNIFQEIGMLPKGGAAFFLTRMLGSSKAKELLLLEPQIPSDMALEYGIVDRVAPPEDLEQVSMDVARRFGQIHNRTLRGVKRLANYSIEALEAYLAFETEEIIRISRGHQFNDI